MKIIGHRGAKGLAPENTLASFAKALEHQVDLIELDVRVTKDGKTVLIHDPHLQDYAGNRYLVRSHTFDELQARKTDLISLEKALRYIDRQVPVIVEIKPAEPTIPVITVIKQLIREGWQPADFVFASFDQSVLLDLKLAFPDSETAVIESWSGMRATRRAAELHTRRLHMRSWWLWVGFLAPMKRRGWQISPYTMNNPRRVRKWQKYLYGVVTDYPDLFTK